MEVKPMKAVIVGVILSFLIVMISGLSLMFMFADVASPDFEAVLASNNTYLLVSIVASFLSLVIASFIATKYAPYAEVKFGVIIGLLMIAINLPTWVMSGTFSIYPVWYAVLSFAMPVPAAYLGSIIRGQRHNKVQHRTRQTVIFCEKCCTKTASSTS
jgi:hypothetical protein